MIIIYKPKYLEHFIDVDRLIKEQRVEDANKIVIECEDLKNLKRMYDLWRSKKNALV